MKKLVYLFSAVVILTTISCKKNTDGNKGVLVQESEENIGKRDSLVQEKTDRYVADDGSSTLVTFKNTGKEKSISISSNKMTIEAPQTDVAGVYAAHDFEIVSKNDSVIITQGNNVINLKKARGQ